jgi:hypothetical protein
VTFHVVISLKTHRECNDDFSTVILRDEWELATLQSDESLALENA